MAKKKDDNPELFEENEDATKAEAKTRDTLRAITTEMEESYLSYAMSVIVSRALPDVRDGLKPVHRRILFAMSQLGLRSSAKFRKSATVVGEVLGKYHPHGDTAVYDSMVRMAQDFSLRYMLVNGQGNFGSIDGDRAAAMRYTEAKMMNVTDELLADIDKDTVDFRDNYDGSQQEPVVLPSKFPQLLLNGTMGIAVAMATSIPPHNLTDICETTVKLLDEPDTEIDDLFELLKGPDFPTGGIIYDTAAIKNMYATGRGGIILRAKTEITELTRGKSAIIVTEIPYQVNKSTLVTKIAELVRDKKIVGISDLRDESNREGIRVVIELKKDAYPKKILNQLFKLTPLQTKFNMNMIALVDGIQPRLLNLKQVLQHFIDHRVEVVTRRTKFELAKAEARAHILEGLIIALENIDEVIKTIKKSATKEDAHAALMKKFKLSDEQAKAILEMRLQTLAGLERKKIEDEHAELMKLIKELKAILGDPQKVIAIIKGELEGVQDKYGDERRTDIVANPPGKITSTDTIPNEPMILTLTEENYVKRMPPGTFKVQHRGGKGIKGLTTKEEDTVKIVEFARNHDHLLFFSNLGKVYKIRMFEVPQASRTAKGQSIMNLLPMSKEEYVTSVMIIPEDPKAIKGQFLLMGTRRGTVKKTSFEEFTNVRKSGLIAIKLRDGDTLNWVKSVNEGDEVVIVTEKGKCIRFMEDEVRPMGRAATGVRGIALKESDRVVEMDAVKNEGAKLLVVMENGLGKSTGLNNYRQQHRGGTGVKTANVTSKTGSVIGAVVVRKDSDKDLLLLSRKGQAIRLSASKVPSQGRATQGVYVMRLNGPDKVVSLSVLPNSDQIKAERDAIVAAKDKKKAKSKKASSKQESLPV